MHIDIIDSRRFRRAEQIGVMIAPHDRKHGERKVLDDSDRAFALAEVGRTQLARMAFTKIP